MANLDSELAAAFSELEESFFREGDAMSAEAELAAHGEAQYQSHSREAAEPAPDDDWDWKIALARVRPATQPG